ncbi:flagellar motor protein MotB [Wolinella succinogenes]|uniref:MOTB PROTEIN n=1 Tax=Wolinella succinogenes (strain ATCC 29543 / DSM 1740 / CCUG 13145 / JCM 31913 / LMG 7466 / NCTC 11488 / FDC 602W) TaxID=273121 RepID=Q7MAF3_WOLSU|nr:flagellar motor protein MotB [Wolinella succinogenes]NLU35385.1 flagellar motor protein MotB [Wolinella succinogenes]CAE09443.1 MOTB PROTEIN [Wolinella succinogenes]VEG81656.1 Chemotaxis protein MotB [Wolinella succinogenes]HCZ19867.1 motility protein MotB [Helicobacter sp.]
MAKKCPPCDCKKGLPLWLGTFGDLMSLLLTFFILLLSMATFEKQKIEQAIGSIQGALGVLEKGQMTEIMPPKRIQALPIQQNVDTPEAINAFASMITEYSEMTKISDGPAVKMEEAEDGFILSIPSELLFESGSATITNKEGILFLKRTALEINKLSNDMHIKVIGHTDNDRLRPTATYKDNWELSIARGVNVAKMLLEERVNPARISAGGNGEFDPVASNATPEGKAKNRRVDLYFFSVSKNEEEIKKSQKNSN